MLAFLNSLTYWCMLLLFCDRDENTLTSAWCRSRLVLSTVLVSSMACPFLSTLFFMGPLADSSDLTMLSRLLVSRNVRLSGRLTVTVLVRVRSGLWLEVRSVNLRGVTAAQSVAPYWNMPTDLCVSCLGLLNGDNLIVRLSIRLTLILWRTCRNAEMTTLGWGTCRVVVRVTLMSVAVSRLFSTTFSFWLSDVSRDAALSVPRVVGPFCCRLELLTTLLRMSVVARKILTV